MSQVDTPVNKIRNIGLAWARIGHAAIIYSYLDFTADRLKFIAQRGFSDDDALILLSGFGSSLFFGIILGELLYRKFAPRESGILLLFNFILSYRAKMEMEKELMEKEPNVEEHLESIPDDLPNLHELKEAIHNEDLTTKFWAIGELERMGNEHAIGILECAITDKREQIRIAAKEAIARIKNQ